MAAFAALQQTGGVKKQRWTACNPSYQAYQSSKEEKFKQSIVLLAGDAFKIKTKSGAEAIASAR